MPAVPKLAVSIGELASIFEQGHQSDCFSKCALRSALRALIVPDGESQKAITPDAAAVTNLYALMKNCAFFNGGDCDCASNPFKASLTVVYRSRHQL
jgi:hypothetical protein